VVEVEGAAALPGLEVARAVEAAATAGRASRLGSRARTPLPWEATGRARRGLGFWAVEETGGREEDDKERRAAAIIQQASTHAAKAVAASWRERSAGVGEIVASCVRTERV
jgi:hypothetical protein